MAHLILLVSLDRHLVGNKFSSKFIKNCLGISLNNQEKQQVFKILLKYQKTYFINLKLSII